MKTVRLITCNDSFQAHLIQGALKNEGIDSILQNDNTSGVLRGYISPISGVDIFVAEEQYALIPQHYNLTLFISS